MHDTTKLPEPLRPAAWTSVNRWECDENDHLNVRFHAAKMNEALQLAVADLGLAPAPVERQHMRFLAEARVATPLRIDFGIVAGDGGSPALLTEMRNLTTGAALATVVTGFATRLALDGARSALPDHAAPRGLPDPLQDPPPSVPERYITIGRGVIGHAECDPSGAMLPAAYVARISDGMPNLWSAINGPVDAGAHARGEQGGAVLEYRLRIHAPRSRASAQPLAAGDRFTQRTALTALGNKTMNVSHLLINESTGECAASALVLAIAMDLSTRRAVPISAERRARMARLLVAGDGAAE